MFTINQYKNESVNNIKFENNAVVLLLQNIASNGNVTIKVLQFTGCSDTKPTTIVKHLLKSILAEFNVAEEFNAKFGTFETGATVNGVTEKVRTGIQAKRKFSAFLRTSVIYKTDNNGKLSHAVKCDNGIMLSDTALNIKSEQLATLYEYNSAQFRSALHHTATAVLEQCSFFSAVETEFNNIENGLLELAKQEQEQKKKELEQHNEKKNAKEQKKIA